MTSYINQTIARQLIAERIAEAEQARLSRAFRRGRRDDVTEGSGSPAPDTRRSRRFRLALAR